jgi:hypothetical protein
MPPRRERMLVFGLALGGLALRLIAVGAFATTPSSDAMAYHLLGSAIAGGRGFTFDGHPETIWAPGYPALVASVYALVGAHARAVYVVQALLDVGACLLLWQWTRRRAGATVALATLALSSVSLSAIAAIRFLRSEALAGWLLLGAMVLVDRARDSRRELWLVAAAGALLGLLTLSRWQFSLFPFFVAAVLLADRKWRAPALLLAAYLAVLTPWIARNYEVLGSPVLSTQTGMTLYMSHFRNPGQPWGVNTSDATTRAAAQMAPLDGNRYLVHETMHRLSEHPTLVLRTFPEKLIYLLVPLDWEVLRSRRTFNVTYFLIALLALVGAPTLLRADRRFLQWLSLPLAYLAVMALPFYGSPRFRLPAEPLLTPIAAIGLLHLWRRAPRSAEASA